MPDEFKDINFANPFKTPRPEPDGRGDGYDPDGAQVASEFRAAFAHKDQPVEYAEGDDDESSD